MDLKTEIIIFSRANAYIQEISETDRAKVLAQIVFMKEGDYTNLFTKKLDGIIRELIVKQHRIIYFKKNNTLYFVSAFRKQSAKTPKAEIEYAKDVFKMI